MTTEFSRSDFINAVNHTSVSDDVKDYAENFQEAIWNNVGLHWKVTQTGENSIEFVEGGRINGEGPVSKLTATIDIGPPLLPIPPHRAHDQASFLSRIQRGHDDYIGAGSYWIESHFYGNDLRLGGDAMAQGPGELVQVFGKDYTALTLTAPTV